MKKDREEPLAGEDPQARKTSPGGENRRVPLDQVEENQQAKVIDIQGGWGVKRRLSQMGIHPGDILKLVRYGPLGGPLVIEVHGFQLALGRGVASQIFVEEVVA